MREICVNIFTTVTEHEHRCTDAELYYVLDGVLRITEQNKEYELAAGDIMLVNANRTCDLFTQEEGMICRITLSYAMICSRIRVDFLVFKCNSVLEQGEKYQRLSQLIQDILLDYIDAQQERAYRQDSLYARLVDLLLQEFRMSDMLVTKRQKETDGKLTVILNYIYMNYDHTVTLADLADRLFMSASSVSRFFLKATGKSIVQYVKEYRLQMVTRELLETEKPITRIAVENGFSNPSVMNKDFKSFYGITPGQYRENALQEREEQREQLLRRKVRLKEILNQMEEEDREKAEEIVTVDTAGGGTYQQWNNRILNVGPAYVLETAQLQQQVLFLMKELKTEYVRIWSIFSQNLMLLSRDMMTVNFNKLDAILDFCVSHGFCMFFDLAPRTNMAKSSESRDVYRNENSFDFESQYEWEFFLEKFIRHIKHRYGLVVVSDWIFEFSFFLNDKPYYISESYSSRTVWESAYQIIKREIPGAKVAGPGLVASQDRELIENLIDHFLDAKYRPDIFTSFHFPYKSIEDNKWSWKKLSDTDFMDRQTAFIKECLAHCGFQGDYCITDWNVSVANRNYIQDSCFRGTFILKNMIENAGKADAMGFFYASDLINIWYDSDGILTGCAGMLTQNGFCKPAFYAFRFLSEMGDWLIARGENYIVTRNADDAIQILCFNNKNLGYNYFQMEEDLYKPDELSRLFQNHDLLQLNIVLENLQDESEFVISRKVVNEKQGSILDAWIRLKCARELTLNEMRYLEQMSLPGMAVERSVSNKGRLELDMYLLPHEMRWISIEKANK